MIKLLFKKVFDFFLANIFGIIVFGTLNSFCQNVFQNQNVDEDIYNGITLFLGIVMIFCVILLLRLKKPGKFENYSLSLDGSSFSVKKELKQIVTGIGFLAESIILAVYCGVIAFNAAVGFGSQVLLMALLTLAALFVNVINWLMVRKDWYKKDAFLREQNKIEKEMQNKKR